MLVGCGDKGWRGKGGPRGGPSEVPVVPPWALEHAQKGWLAAFQVSLLGEGSLQSLGVLREVGTG